MPYNGKARRGKKRKVRIMKGDPFFACEECGVSFAVLANYLKHIENRHPERVEYELVQKEEGEW